MCPLIREELSETRNPKVVGNVSEKGRMSSGRKNRKNTEKEITK